MKSIDLVGQWECSGRYRNMVRRCWVKSIGLAGQWQCGGQDLLFSQQQSEMTGVGLNGAFDCKFYKGMWKGTVLPSDC